MELVHLLGGGAPVVKKYQASIAITNAGVVLEADDAGMTARIGSVKLPPASGITTMHAGICLDTTTSYPTTPSAQLDADANILVTVIINPDAVYRSKLSGGAASDTALTRGTAVATADTVGEETGITSISGGVIWGLSGANEGVYRGAIGTTGNVGISFPNTIAVGDVYTHAGCFPCSALPTSNIYMNLTTDLTQSDGQTGTVDEDNFVCVDVELHGDSEEGTTNSYVHLMSLHHIFGAGLGVAMS